MEPNRLLTLMALPQHFDGENLHLNLVLIPRNKNPEKIWNVSANMQQIPVPGFSNFQPQFSISIVKGTVELPIEAPGNPAFTPIEIPVSVDEALQKADLIEKIAKSFKMDIGDDAEVLPPPKPESKTVRKYLPVSYRESFNFTQPRHPNAVTDDSYACAIRDQKPSGLIAPKTSLSWGKVFAHIIRQPLLAKACGMIYSVSVKVDKEWFEKGGYIYANIINEPYLTAQKKTLESNQSNLNGPLVKRYAARIPKLKIGETRPVFSALTFPVTYKKASDPQAPVPIAPWDELFLESRSYDDGFAKVVHANQPISGNMLEEKPDGFAPQSETGIRLGWDDEQILVWYIRQLAENPQEAGKRIDAPLCVNGYKIDVREPGKKWESLNSIELDQNHPLVKILATNKTEIPYQVYPNKISGPNDDFFWMPMYYASWLGKSMVAEDKDAIKLFKTDQNYSEYAKGNPGKPGVDPNKTLNPIPLNTDLRYGGTYEFRVRLADISGGGPKVEDSPLNDAASPLTTVSFRRYINPDLLRIEKPLHLLNQTATIFNAGDDDETSFDDNTVLHVKRPMLEYPAVIFTKKYPNALDLLRNQTFPDKNIKPALADPDVTKVYIRVEVKSLRMDNAWSQNGKDDYITLYQTHRFFPSDFEQTLDIPIQFIDVPVLNLGNEANPFLRDDLKSSNLNGMNELVLPTGRQIRVTMRAVAEVGGNSEEYFGVIDPDQELDSRYGKKTQLSFYRPPFDENEPLLGVYGNVPEIQGIYLRPDEVPTLKKNQFSALIQRISESNQSEAVKRLADALGCESKGMTLVAPKGQRIAFGCSNRIRHSLAPDGSSITFASNAELQNHWIGALSYQLDRDWAWDALQNDAFSIFKTHKFRNDRDQEWRKKVLVGEIELKHTVSFEAIQDDRYGQVNRSFTRIIFLDALEPKNDLKHGVLNQPRFPDEIWANYEIEANFKSQHPGVETKKTPWLALPTVLPPSQIPKIKSVGIAFSPYDRADDYSSTEARRRHLWVEFEEPIHNPDDQYFCRVLANSPDQLISNNSPEQFLAPEESPINLDPEWIRVITPGQSNDLSGLNAMQQMVPSTDSDRHFILPLPPGMYSESPEMFGFFTYEFRVGHGHFVEREEVDKEFNLDFLSVNELPAVSQNAPKGNLWSTAQGRFGRPLRVTGVQHPAPNLLCTLNRDDLRMFVSAPFAKAVYNGKNVTSKPPRTSLWAVLYAQVYQADGLDFRNILLGEKEMKIGVKINPKKGEKDQFQELLAQSYQVNKVPDLIQASLKLDVKVQVKGNVLAQLKDKHPVGTAIFTSEEIAQRLSLFGLPEDSPLSVLVVEVFGNITNLFDHMDVMDLYRQRINPEFERMARSAETGKRPETIANAEIRPLSRGLGHFRILRTSPLTKVPFVCCPTCE
ncbi:hypothetical protein DFQ04_1159 [Algoriphagus boseongensis]|uniref:Uncharacterized protein n=1 Tax=Algoriphagus boseongensis TaxID=1442587 RepID=A0A4R6T7Z9_9BACT|nr:hypothetical protein [Algoriphagus boseongensis]TDQ19338.1 hypothetical protein DFQ04_1159 [Algoriphagus boseongensis]